MVASFISEFNGHVVRTFIQEVFHFHQSLRLTCTEGIKESMSLSQNYPFLIICFTDFHKLHL